MNKNNWLSDHANNKTSQNGEDGILKKIFEVIPGLNNWCVEFGAWDGKFLSNCYSLITDKGWSSVMIEASNKKYNELLRTYNNNANVHCIKAFVNFEGKNSLDSILAKTPIPKDFDLISIDIDSSDYHIWDSLKSYKPKVVVIEYNPAIPMDIEFVQERSFNVYQGSSLLSLTKLAKEKGYELICTTHCNGIFVNKKYFDLFNISNNSLEEIHEQVYESPRLFQLFDGTLMLTDEYKMIWKAPLVVKQKDLQILPSFFRFKNDSGISKLKRKLYYLYLKLKGK